LTYSIRKANKKICPTPFTNLLIYHTEGSEVVSNIIRGALARKAFNVSVLTKIEFLGWEKHSPEGFEKCSRLIKLSNVYLIDDDIAEKTIELKRLVKIKLADTVIAATALVLHEPDSSVSRLSRISRLLHDQTNATN